MIAHANGASDWRRQRFCLAVVVVMAAQTCVGDCNGDNTVGINEPILGGFGTVLNFISGLLRVFPKLTVNPQAYNVSRIIQSLAAAGREPRNPGVWRLGSIQLAE